MLIHFTICSERTPGGELPQMRGPPGEILAERILTEMTAVSVMIAVGIVGTETAEMTETAETTVTTEAHPEVTMMVNRTCFRTDI